jgi:hypothetical protein
MGTKIQSFRSNDRLTILKVEQNLFFLFFKQGLLTLLRVIDIVNPKLKLQSE